MPVDTTLIKFSILKNSKGLATTYKKNLCVRNSSVQSVSVFCFPLSIIRPYNKAFGPVGKRYCKAAGSLYQTTFSPSEGRKNKLNIRLAASQDFQPASKENKWENTLQKTLTLKSLIDFVKYPVITEKTYFALSQNRQYTFDIDKRLNKTQIKKLFQSLFNVEVIAVNTHIPPRRKLRVGMAQGFRPSFKRAIITLKEGSSLNYSFKSEN